MRLFDSISLELIDYQNNDPFPGKLAKPVEGVYKEIDNKVYMDNKTLIEKSTYIKDIEKLIKDRFNLNIQFAKTFHVISPAAIIPFFGDYLRDLNGLKGLGSDLVSKLFSGFNDFMQENNAVEKERRELLNRLHNKKGYIDLKNARVGGYLSEVKHYLIIDFFTMKRLGLTERELVAVILHEIGHAFTGLEYHHKLEKINSTIADILDNINKNKMDKAVYIFKKNFSKKEFENISANSKSEIYDFYGALALTYLDEIKTQMVDSKYDETNFENLADSFASRFNMYKELVSGLDKVLRVYGQVFDNTPSQYATVFIVEILLFALYMVLFTPIGGIIAAALFITMNKSDIQVMVYDNPKDRYERIKNSLINNIKNINMPEELLKDLLEQFFFIDQVVQKSGYFESIYKKVADIIFTSNRRANYYIKIQQDIEKGLNNKLFVSAARLKVSA